MDDRKLFSFVVTFFYSWGWQALGKVPDPATGKESKNLDMARQVVDILSMLGEKTKGNLDNEEEKLLLSTLSELQINYVDEVEKAKQEKTPVSEDAVQSKGEEAVEEGDGENPAKEEE